MHCQGGKHDTCPKRGERAHTRVCGSGCRGLAHPRVPRSSPGSKGSALPCRDHSAAGRFLGRAWPLLGTCVDESPSPVGRGSPATPRGPKPTRGPPVPLVQRCSGAPPAGTVPRVGRAKDGAGGGFNCTSGGWGSAILICSCLRTTCLLEEAAPAGQLLGLTRRVYLILSRCRRPRAGDLSAAFVWGRALPRKEAARLSPHQDASLAPHSTAALSFLRLCLPQRPSSPIPPGGGNPPGAPPVADPKSSPPTRANRNRVGTLPIPATGIGTAHRPLPIPLLFVSFILPPGLKEAAEPPGAQSCRARTVGAAGALPRVSGGLLPVCVLRAPYEAPGTLHSSCRGNFLLPHFVLLYFICLRYLLLLFTLSHLI